MKILIACEFSGIIREAFIKKGHYAMSCDLLPTEIPGNHYQGDVFDIINDGWDMMIAFPPCTHLAGSGARSFPEKIKDGRQKKAIAFFMNLVDAPIEKICIENPVGIMSTIHRKPDQIIHPYYFGDTIPKKTCLWLKNLPRLNYYFKGELFERTVNDPEYYIYNSKKNKSGKSKYSIYGKLGKGCGKQRSITSIYLAKAMAEQWGSL
jgi:hypothetical protein